MNTNQILEQIDTQPDNGKEFSSTFRLPGCDTDTKITSDSKQRLKDMVTMLFKHRSDVVFYEKPEIARLPGVVIDENVVKEYILTLSDMVTTLIDNRPDVVFSHDQDDIQHERRSAK